MDVTVGRGQVVIGGRVTNSTINGVQVGGGPQGPVGAPQDRVTLGEQPPQQEASWKNMWGLFGKGSEPKVNENGGVTVQGDLVGKTITVGTNGVVIE